MGRSREIEILEAKLQELEQMPYKDLQGQYLKVFGRQSSAKDKEFFVRALSYRLQEKTYGGLPKTALNKLSRLAFEGQEKMQPSYHMQPGTHLSREWNGKRYTVLVRPNGFEYAGKIYKSLSSVANIITGVPWSGPLFFGIRKFPKKKAKA